MIQDMKLRKCVYLMCSAVMTFLMVGCTQNEIPEVYPDGTGQIRFGVNGVNIGGEEFTRAGGGIDYRDWNAASDPTTMGVFGFYGSNLENDVFDNQLVKYDGESKPWKYEKVKYWNYYFDSGRMDFFSYMPYNANVTLTAEGSKYTLAIPNVPALITNQADLRLVCNKPVGYEDAYNHTTPIPMYYDQTMAKFSVAFKLGSKMGEIRHFHIKNVRLWGVPKTATCSQSYTFNNGEWEKGELTISDFGDDVTTAKDGALNLVEDEDYYLPINSADYRIFGTGNYDDTFSTNPKSPIVADKDKSIFYMFPMQFNGATQEWTPVLEVTYYIYDEAGYQTREATQTIALTKDNFPEVWSGNKNKAGYYNQIQILIVPDYLYVLSDADQTAGVLVIKK